MPTFNYTRSDLKADMNALIQGKFGILSDSNRTINRGVRETI